ncbi:MAG: 2-oxoglutarate dehydrogenase E1 component, partial [uncultured bacterium]
MPQTILQKFEKNSYLSGDSADYIDAMYESYLQDQDSVSDEWKNYFSSLGKNDISHAAIRDALKQSATLPLPLPLPLP